MIFLIIGAILVTLILVLTSYLLIKEMLQDDEKLPYIIWLLLIFAVATLFAWLGCQLYLET